MNNISTISINIGVMGHVDCGKTSLVRAIYNKGGGVISTAGLDKHPQSQERGITIDLGFTSLSLLLDEDSSVTNNNDISEITTKTTDQPACLVYRSKRYATICFVDCPGHGTLLRAVLSASQIVDQIMLVIDIEKGFQQQTAECLLIAQIMCPNIIVVLNKIDRIPLNKRQQKIQFITEKLRDNIFSKTCYGRDVPIVAVSAHPVEPIGLSELFIILKANIQLNIPIRDNQYDGLIFLYDHAFTKKGSGTILTGTVIAGSIRIGDDICLSQIPHEKKRIRSIQAFKKTVEELSAGERGALCIQSGLPLCSERGLLTDSMHPLPFIRTFIAVVKKIPQFKLPIYTNGKFNITVGHTTVVGKCHFFSLPSEHDNNSTNSCQATTQLSLSRGGILRHQPLSVTPWPIQFNPTIHYKDEQELDNKTCPLWNPTTLNGQSTNDYFFSLIQIDSPSYIQCPLGSLFIASKLDLTCSQKMEQSCRIAFFGTILDIIGQGGIPKISDIFVGKQKKKMGYIERIIDSESLIAKGLFQSAAHVNSFIGCQVKIISLGVIGRISRSFGKTGKCICIFSKKNLTSCNLIQSNELILEYVINIFDPDKIKNDI